MRNSIITVTILVLAALTACDSTESSDFPVEKVGKDKSKQKDAPTAFNFSEARPLDSTDYVIYRLSATANVEEEDEYGGLSKSSGRSASYRNIVFYNIVTKKYHLLDNRKMLITSYSVEDDAEDYIAKASYKKAPRLIY